VRRRTTSTFGVFSIKFQYLMVKDPIRRRVHYRIASARGNAVAHCAKHASELDDKQSGASLGVENTGLGTSIPMG
jgi:hypothetical protein